MILCSLTPCVWEAIANCLKNSKLQKLESKIDSLVYKLHNLTDDEIATIQRANPLSLRADNGGTRQSKRSEASLESKAKPQASLESNHNGARRSRSRLL